MCGGGDYSTGPLLVTCGGYMGPLLVTCGGCDYSTWEYGSVITVHGMGPY